MQDLAHIRTEYRRMELNRTDLDENPFDLFSQWLQQAIVAKEKEPTAMCLSTIDSYGKPDARIVLLKETTPEGFIFFTNYESSKGQQLKNKPQAALTFFWLELERQVRIRGTVTQTDAPTSDEYFQARPANSRIGAWLSPQSRIITEEWIRDMRKTAASNNIKPEIERPPHWGGFILEPDYFEFWQGRPNRLHDRFRYLKIQQGQWQIDRLAP